MDSNYGDRGCCEHCMIKVFQASRGDDADLG